MQNIKRQVFAQYAQTRQSLLPTIYIELIDIPPNREITGAYERIKNKNYVGIQYDWLARFCNEMNKKRIEIGIERDSFAEKVLIPVIVRSDSQDLNSINYEVSEAFSESDEYKLFHFFQFPIIKLSKLDEQNLAKNAGFENLLYLTWFCHTPRPNLRPCGICTPCREAIKTGLGWRVPLLNRIRYHLYTFINTGNLLWKIQAFLKSKRKRQKA